MPLLLGSRRTRADGFVEYTGLWWKFALPQPILLAHLAVVAALIAWARIREPLSPSALAAGLGAGLLVWSAFEYVFHRWLLHNTSVPLLRRLFWQGMHREHHGYRAMKDPDHHGIHLAISLPAMALVVGAVRCCAHGGFALSATAGWVLGYCCYEGLHWLFHAGEPGAGLGRVRWIRRLWDSHSVHHLKRADVNFGFVTSVWDSLFGTRERPAEPERDGPGAQPRSRGRRTPRTPTKERTS